jgi:sirohydrochlorin cobaltochelatase
LRAACPASEVELAFLESMAPTLPETLARLDSMGVVRVTVVPLFLSQGGHLKDDLPRLLSDARRASPTMEIRVAAALGDAEALTDAIADWALDQHKAF